jgi:hypothetical protein
MIQKSGKVINGFRIDEPRVESFRGRGFDTVVREQKADDPIANMAPEPSEGEQSWPARMRSRSPKRNHISGRAKLLPHRER